MSQSLAKSIGILQMLADGPCGLGDLSSALGVHKSTVLRLLQTLENGALVTRDKQHRYRLGHMLYSLARSAVGQSELRNAAEPTMRQVNAETGQTIHLAELHGDRILYVEKLEGSTALRMYSQVGLLVPIQTAAAAKAILALESPEVVDAVLSKATFDARTPTSIPDITRYHAALAQVRRSGFAVDDGEFEPLIKCVGVPIFGPTGAVCGALSITVATSGDLGEVIRMAPRLKAAAEEISQTLGARPIRSRSDEFFDGMLTQSPTVAILPNLDAEAASAFARGFWAAGVKLIAVPLQRPGDYDVLARLSHEAPRDTAVGAGGITRVRVIEGAAQAGARFLTGPGISRLVATDARLLRLPYMPGVATATEIDEGLELGLSWMMAFPAVSLGPSWFAAQHAAFPDVSLVAAGGVTANNADAFVAAGAAAVGVVDLAAHAASHPAEVAIL